MTAAPRDATAEPVRLGGVPLAATIIRAVPPFAFLAVLLFLRSLADSVTDITLGTAVRFNLAAILGLAVMGYAAILLAATKTAAGLRIVLVILGAVAVWVAVAWIVHGADIRILREGSRVAAIVAVGVIVTNAWDSKPSRIAGLVAACLVIPIIVAIVQFGLNLGNFGPQGTRDFFRVTGTFVQANKAAQIFVLAAGIGLWVAMATRYRYAGFAILAGALIALLGTRSMGGLGAMVAAAIAFILLTRVGRVVKIGVVLIVVASLFVFAVSPLGASRLASLTETSLPWDVVGPTTNSLEWRLLNWWLFLEQWLQQPFLGHGLGSTQTVVQPLGQVTHSDVIRALVETGIVGAAGLTAAVAAAGVALRNMVRMPTRAGWSHALLVRMCAALLIGLGVQSTVQNTSANTALLYLLVALAVSLWVDGRNRQRQPNTSSR